MRLYNGKVFGMLYKNYLTKRRNFFSTFFEFAIPLILGSIVAIGYSWGKEKSLGTPRRTRVEPLFNMSRFKADIWKKSEKCIIRYAPHDATIELLRDKLQEILDELSNNSGCKVEGLASEAAINAKLRAIAVLNRTERSSFDDYIIFERYDGIIGTKGGFKYKIKSKNLLSNEVWVNTKSVIRYDFSKIFLPLQFIIEEAYLRARHESIYLHDRIGGAVKITDFTIIPMPKSSAAEDLSPILQFRTFLLFSSLITFLYISERICTEKNDGSREMLKMCGVDNCTYWITNVIFNWVYVSLTCGVIVLIVKVSKPIFSGHSIWLMTDTMLLCVFFVVFSLQITLVAALITVFFSRSSVCMTFTIMYFFCSLYTFGLFQSEADQSKLIPWSPWVFKLGCFSPIFAYQMATHIMFYFETKAINLDFSSFSYKLEDYEGLSMDFVMISMVTSCVIYSVLLGYLDAVWPWQPGVPKSPLFFLTFSFWCPRKNEQIDAGGDQVTTGDGNYFEPEDLNKEVAIQCVNVTKAYQSWYKTGRKVAVENLNLKIYEGGITCLLGHNGAGKTTTMSMMTGMFTPTKGNIYVNGYSLLTNTSQARKNMSLCPQIDPLCVYMTVREHLYLYASVKGIASDELTDEVNSILEQVSMKEHQDKTPTELSGGMKRKLSLGIALVGGSKILILDEPSSGLDTEARRFMWNLLKRVRQDRTILLTTHDMEEADALADRIIIMHNGAVMCSGSPLYLKTALGTGYLLTISHDETFRHQEVLNLVHEYMPRATVKQVIGSEVIYELKDDPGVRANLSAFFKVLEKRQKYFGVETFGISLSTMDEVFHKIGDIAAQTDEADDTSSHEPSEFDKLVKQRENRPIQRKTGFALKKSRLCALLLKRFHFSRRSIGLFLFNLSLPIIIIGLALYLEIRTKIPPKQVVIDTKMYRDTHLTVAHDDRPESKSFVGQLRNTAKGVLFRELGREINFKGTIPEYYRQQIQKDPDRYSRIHVFGLYLMSTGPAEDGGSFNFTVWVNTDAIFAQAVMLNLISKTRHSRFSQANDLMEMAFETASQSHSSGVVSIGAQLKWIVVFPLAVSFIAASYVTFPTFERITKAKLIQIMTGLSPMFLHFGSFLYDLFNHSFAAVSILILMALIDPDSYVPDALSVIAILSLLMLFGASSIVLAYIISLLLDAESTGYVLLTLIYSISGILLGSMMVILESLKIFGFSAPFDALYPFANISPIFTMAWGFKKLHANYYVKAYCDSFGDSIDTICRIFKNQTDPSSYSSSAISACCKDICFDTVRQRDQCVYSNPFGWTGNRVGIEITSLLFTLILFTLILYFLEVRGEKFIRYLGGLPILPPRQFDDSDVNDDRKRVRRIIRDGRQDTEALVAQGLYKKFGHRFAVRGVSFYVHKQECFGLLGVNGAGKSTTFGMLTGDILPDSGDVWCEMNSLNNDPDAYLQSIGYCPQVNPLIDRLTGSEMIYLLGRLRGVPANDLAALCAEMVALVNLEEKVNKLCGGYSGGNKRRLSIAMAMMGQPKLVFLDEPTAGVDPSARRKIWSCLGFIREKYNCSMILTSHSMGECEALCSRMGIMVRGEFVCMGTIQHLRAKFGRGYTLTLKMKPGALDDDRYLRSFERTFHSTFPKSSVIDNHETMFVYRIPRDAGKLSYIFDRMETIYQQYDLEDYSLSDTTLEQIFIRFVRKTQRKALPDD